MKQGSQWDGSTPVQRTAVDMNKCSRAHDTSVFIFFVCELAVYSLFNLVHIATSCIELYVALYETMVVNLKTAFILSMDFNYSTKIILKIFSDPVAKCCELVAVMVRPLHLEEEEKLMWWCGLHPIRGSTEQWPLYLFGPVQLPHFIRVMAQGLVSLPDWNLNWFVHLFLCVPSRRCAPAAAVCHLNNKCRWFPDLVRGAGLWCILILRHGALFQGPSFIWIKEVEFKNSQCFAWIQIASIYCAELWNRR